MSIEEAILQEKELAKCKREEAYSWTKEGWEKAFKNLTLGQEQEIRLRREEMAKMSIEIAIGHEQIAGWLQELKERREAEMRMNRVWKQDQGLVEPNPSEKIEGYVISTDSIEAMGKLAERLPEIVEGIQEAMKKLVEAFTSEAICEYIQRKEEES